MPVSDVLLPPSEVTTTFLAVFLSRQDIETVDCVNGQIDRATVT